MAERSIKNVLVDHGRVGTIVKGMQRREYASIGAMNASSLKAGLIGSNDIDPKLIRDSYECTRPAPSSDLQASYDRGTLAHTILLEPEKLVDAVAVWKGDRRAGQEWKEFNEANRGKLVMRESDVREVQSACRAVRSVPQVNDLLRRKHDTELAVFGKHSKTYLQGLLDSVTTDDGPVTIVDLKTTLRGIDEESVLRTIRKLHYREQLGMYARMYSEATGRDVEKVVLLFVALDEVGVRIVRLTTSALQFGWSRMAAAIESVESCIEKDEWPVFFGDSICDVSEWEIGADNLEGFDE